MHISLRVIISLFIKRLVCFVAVCGSFHFTSSHGRFLNNINLLYYILFMHYRSLWFHPILMVAFSKNKNPLVIHLFSHNIDLFDFIYFLWSIFIKHKSIVIHLFSQHTATHCNTLQHTATHRNTCGISLSFNTLQQHIATSSCNTSLFLQYRSLCI